MMILIDNGHGSNTPGKCSPDKVLREYAWAREVAAMLEKALKGEGVDCVRITPEEYDVSIKSRVVRANRYCRQYGASNCLLVSLHLNAAGGDGKWHEATGWSGWVAPNASAKSKAFAALCHVEAEARGLKGNRSVPSTRYWTGNFGIVRDTNCPAVLTENLFQDNKTEAAFLMSDKGKQTIVDLHVAAIKEYIKEYGN